MYFLSKPNILKSNQGFTLIENLVGIALLAIVIVVGTQGFDYIKKGTTQITTLNTNDNRVLEIIHKVRANVSNQIISFPTSIVSKDTETFTAVEKTQEYIERILNVETLPMAWSIQTDSSVAECSSCPGRYGYIITAVPQFGNLYKVTIRMTHKDWGTGLKDFKDYIFLVNQ